MQRYHNLLARFPIPGWIAGRRRGEIGPGPLAFWLVLPAVAFLTFIVAYPIFYAFWLSLHEVTLAGLARGELPFIGTANYRRLFDDPIFWRTLLHSLQFVAMTVFLEVTIGLTIALIINARGAGSFGAVNKVVMLLPWAVPPIANGLMWSYIYNPSFGYLNVVLYKLGIISDFMQFAGNPNLAMLSVVVAFSWRVIPFSILLFHAALQGIPRELYDAAEVDGAGAWHTFRHVTLPLLAPVLLVILILRTGFAFTVFEEIYAITGGGPGDTTWVVSWYTYQHAFTYLNFGYGSASAYTMAMIMVFIAAIYIYIIYRRVDYA